MAFNRKFSEEVGILASIDPASKSANTYTTGWVDLSIWNNVAAVIFVGTISANGTVAAKLEQSGPTSGTNTKDVTGKAITGLTQTPTDNSNSQLFINCRADELDMESTNNFRYVRLSVTTAVAATVLGATIMGQNCKYGPAGDHDATSVTQYI